MTRAPRIGIHPELVTGEKPKLSLGNRYVEAIRRAGGLPFVLPPLFTTNGAHDADWLDEVLEDLDGLVLSGGDDFDTERLGLGPTHPAATPVPGEKQDSDLALARAALERDTVTLGICYGMQLLGLAEGATLFQDLPSECPGIQEHRGGVRHPVRAERGTKLAAFVEVAPFDVTSRHHQALASCPDGWHVSARDEEGLIEAIEHPGRTFVHGVQWHPELSPPGQPDERLFRAFVRAAGERRRPKTAFTELEPTSR